MKISACFINNMYHNVHQDVIAAKKVFSAVKPLNVDDYGFNPGLYGHSKLQPGSFFSILTTDFNIDCVDAAR